MPIERKNSRDKILKTARQLLPRYGYNGISIREIAARARLTTGAIYFHFKNKKEIYRTICLEALDILIQKFKEGIDKRKTPSQKLISTFDSYIEFFQEHRDYYNILMEFKYDYGTGDKKSGKEIAEKMDQITRFMEEIIEQGIEQGDFRKINPRMLSLLLGSVTEGMLQYKKFGSFEHMNISYKEFRTFMADIIGNGIMKD